MKPATPARAAAAAESWKVEEAPLLEVVAEAAALESVREAEVDIEPLLEVVRASLDEEVLMSLDEDLESEEDRESLDAAEELFPFALRSALYQQIARVLLTLRYQWRTQWSWCQGRESLLRLHSYSPSTRQRRPCDYLIRKSRTIEPGGIAHTDRRPSTSS